MKTITLREVNQEQFADIIHAMTRYYSDIACVKVIFDDIYFEVKIALRKDDKIVMLVYINDGYADEGSDTRFEGSAYNVYRSILSIYNYTFEYLF